MESDFCRSLQLSCTQALRNWLSFSYNFRSSTATADSSPLSRYDWSRASSALSLATSSSSAATLYRSGLLRSDPDVDSLPCDFSSCLRLRFALLSS